LHDRIIRGPSYPHSGGRTCANRCGSHRCVVGAVAPKRLGEVAFGVRGRTHRSGVPDLDRSRVFANAAHPRRCELSSDHLSPLCLRCTQPIKSSGKRLVQELIGRGSGHTILNPDACPQAESGNTFMWRGARSHLAVDLRSIAGYPFLESEDGCDAR
jgi:hypothetical protein